MAYEPIDPAKALTWMKLKYREHKGSSGGKSSAGSSAVKAKKLTGIRPRKKAYGPF